MATHTLASKTKAFNNVFLQTSVFIALFIEVSNVISAFISHSSEVTQMSKVILTLQWAALLKTKLLLSHILLEMLCDPLNSSIIKGSALWDDLQWYSEMYSTHFLGSLGTKDKCQCQLLLESSVIVECINLDTFFGSSQVSGHSRANIFGNCS